MPRMFQAVGLCLTFVMVSLTLSPASDASVSAHTQLTPTVVAIDFDPMNCTGHWSNLDRMSSACLLPST